jgi:hypothetical protein
LIHRCATRLEPARFNPERFLGRRPDPRTWIPFGGGERRCLGASLAMLELREVLPPIVKRFELRPACAVPEHVRLYGTAISPRQGRAGRGFTAPGATGRGPIPAVPAGVMSTAVATLAATGINCGIPPCENSPAEPA